MTNEITRYKKLTESIDKLINDLAFLIKLQDYDKAKYNLETVKVGLAVLEALDKRIMNND